MNCLWILLLLCCCGGNSGRGTNGCSTCDRTEKMPRRSDCPRFDHDYPASPFAPERSGRDRDRDCECRATEIDEEQ